MHHCTLRHDALALATADLKARRAALEAPGEPLTALADLEDHWRSAAKEAPARQQAAWMEL